MPDPTGEPLQIHDPRMLRAMAHPLRSRLLREITALGHGRAADLATLTGFPANQVSFHLRELAKHGLLVEAPEHAHDKRDRVWKPAAVGGTRFDSHDFLDDPDKRSAYDAWRATATHRQHALVEAAARAPREPGTFIGAIDGVARLTKDEASELAEELAAVIQRWTDHGRTFHSPDDPDVRTYAVLTITQPDPDPDTSL